MIPTSLPRCEFDEWADNLNLLESPRRQIMRYENSGHHLNNEILRVQIPVRSGGSETPIKAISVRQNALIESAYGLVI